MSHNAHLKGVTPECILKCLIRSLFRLNHLLHTVHWKRIFGNWAFCLFDVAFLFFKVLRLVVQTASFVEVWGNATPILLWVSSSKFAAGTFLTWICVSTVVGHGVACWLVSIASFVRFDRISSVVVGLIDWLWRNGVNLSNIK